MSLITRWHGHCHDGLKGRRIVYYVLGYNNWLKDFLRRWNESDV